MKVYLLYTKAVPKTDEHYSECPEEWAVEQVFGSQKLAEEYAKAFFCCETKIVPRHVVREEWS